ncbi:MAG: molybdopterin-binding protein, partial [Solirubrobacterales bacterium]
AGAFVRPAARYAAAGDLMIAAGTRIGVGELTALAAFGLASVECSRRPVVTVLTGGDELVAPGQRRDSAGAYDCNAAMLAAILEGAGASVTTAVYDADDHAIVTALVAEAADASDIVVSCGGISAGRHDHVAMALDQLGGEVRVAGIAARPGRRFVLASLTRDDGEVPVFALPGNPLSAFVCAVLYVRRCVLASLGAPPPPRNHALLSSSIAPDPVLHKLMPARLRRDRLVATVEPVELGSDAAVSLSGCDTLAIIPPGPGASPSGTQIECEAIDG